MTNKFTPLAPAIQANIATANDHLLTVLDLLTPEDRDRTGTEYVLFNLVLAAAKKLPANNVFELAKYK